MKTKKKNERLVSLAPLDLEAALTGLIGVKPQAKLAREKRATKPKRKKAPPPKE
jgi:hypothetical protein